MSKVLIVQEVSKSFGKMRAVDTVSFSVEENEIFGIAGPNGAGKTTLFNTISSIPYHADMGTIMLGDRPIQSLQPHNICRMGIARTFQKETVFDTLSVLDNVLVGAVFGCPPQRESLKDRAHKVLDLVGLFTKEDECAKHLPLVEKKCLMLATALVTQPKILLLDEPAAGLNRVEIQKTIDLILKINELGISIILIEHVLSLLATLSHRIMILNNGKKLVEGLSHEILKDERVIEAYLGERATHETTTARS